MTVHVRNDVHDVRVALDDHQITDAHGAVVGHTADIIACEIDEHDVLGAFLGVIQQFLSQRIVFSGGFAPPASAGDGADVDAAVHALHMNLRRTADEREALREVEAEHVGARIHVPQCAEEIQRGALVVRFKTLRGHALEDVACADVFLHLEHHRLVLLLSGVAHRRWQLTHGGKSLQRLGGQRLLQFGNDIRDLLARPFISGLQRGVLIGMDVGHDGKATGAVIKHQDGVSDHEDHVRQTQFILRRWWERRLKEAHHVIRQVADRAAVEDRQRLRFERGEGLHQLLQLRQWIAGGGVAALLAALLDFDLTTACGEDDSRGAPEQRVAPGVLSELCGFQQEGAAAIVDLLECGERGFVVGGEFRHHRYEIALLRERLKGGEVGLKMELWHAGA